MSLSSGPTVDPVALEERLDRLESYLVTLLRDRQAAPATYSVAQASKVLGLSEMMVRRMVKDGRLPLLSNVGQRMLIPRCAVDDFIRSNTRSSPQLGAPEVPGARPAAASN